MTGMAKPRAAAVFGLLAALVLAFFSNLFSSLTHYANGPAPVIFDVGAHEGSFALLAVAPFPINPEQHVGPKEGKHPDDQNVHEALGDPNLGIAVVVVRVSVGVEANKASWRVLMAFAAGPETVFRMHPGL